MRNIFTGSFPEPYLLAVGKKKIAVVDLTTKYSTFVIEDQNIANLIIDPVDEKMYFKTDKVVYRANFDGYGKKIICHFRGDGKKIICHDENPIRVFALDWIRRRMYFVPTNSTNWMESIFVGRMNFTDTILLHKNEERISSLAVDPNAG